MRDLENFAAKIAKIMDCDFYSLKAQIECLRELMTVCADSQDDLAILDKAINDTEYVIEKYAV